jgi:hypothetical protein
MPAKRLDTNTQRGSSVFSSRILWKTDGAAHNSEAAPLLLVCNWFLAQAVAAISLP